MSHPSPAVLRKCIEWAQMMRSRNDRVILDTEATGIHAKSFIIQIAILSADRKPLLNTYVAPPARRKLPKDVLQMMRVSEDQIMEGRPFKEVREEVISLIGGKGVLSYNAEYRKQIVQSTCDAWKLDPIRCDWACAMIAYAGFVGEWHDGKKDWKFQKLPKSISHLDAMQDCYDTYDMIERMAKTPLPPERINMLGSFFKWLFTPMNDGSPPPQFKKTEWNKPPSTSTPIVKTEPD